MNLFTLDPVNIFPSESSIKLELYPNIKSVSGVFLDTDNDNEPGGETYESWFYTGTASDFDPPSISELVASPNPYGSSSEVTITAQFSDIGDPGSSTIIGGYCFVGDDAETGITFDVTATDGDFDEETENVTATVRIASLPAGSEYNISIQAEDSTGNISEVEPVTINQGSAIYLDKELVFTYPNPCKGNEVRFYFYITKPSTATVNVYDLKGRLVTTISGDAQHSDIDNYFAWDATSVAPGIYTFILNANANDGATGSVSKKFALLR